MPDERKRVSVCGTRAVDEYRGEFLVVCATCDRVFSSDWNRQVASEIATMNSAKPCVCGEN